MYDYKFMYDYKLRTGLRTAALAAVTMAVGAVMMLGSEGPIPGAAAEPSTSSTSSSSSPISSPTSSPEPTTTSATTEFPSDDRGYLNSDARCDDGQTLMILGRTSRSLVAICVGPDGQLEYRGVRLSDEAGITMAASRGSDGTIVATNDNVTYSISPESFLVSEGDTVIYRDSWADYHQPRFSGGATSTTTSAPSEAPTTTSSTATTTPKVSTTTVTLAPTTSTEG